MTSQLSRVSFAHVKAHSGDPWNEAADKMCDRGGRGEVASFSDVGFLEPWTRQPKFAEWAFLFTAPAATREAYPPLCEVTGYIDARPPEDNMLLTLSPEVIARDIDAVMMAEANGSRQLPSTFKHSQEWAKDQFSRSSSGKPDRRS